MVFASFVFTGRFIFSLSRSLSLPLSCLFLSLSQTNSTRVSYVTAVKEIVAADGLVGLFGRGLKTRILANGIQGIVFSVLWRSLDDMLRAEQKVTNAKTAVWTGRCKTLEEAHDVTKDEPCGGMGCPNVMYEAFATPEYP